jgi:hypothetical protein
MNMLGHFFTKRIWSPLARPIRKRTKKQNVMATCSRYELVKKKTSRCLMDNEELFRLLRYLDHPEGFIVKPQVGSASHYLIFGLLTRLAAPTDRWLFC